MEKKKIIEMEPQNGEEALGKGRQVECEKC